MWQNYLNLLLGAVLVVAAFLGLDSNTLVWTMGIVGATIAVLSLWASGVFSTSSESRMSHA